MAGQHGVRAAAAGHAARAHGGSPIRSGVDREKPAQARRDRGRVTGVDLARALAIVGMLAVHIGPTDAEGVAGHLYAAPHGRASILFGLVAGVGVSLLARSRRTSPAQARLTLAWRAALLLPLGLALQLLDHGALVILQDYALLFVLGLAVLALPDRWLLGLAAGAAVLGPLGFLWGLITAPSVFTRDAVDLTDSAASIAHGLVLSGPYPLITWAAPFLFGMWLGRRDLGAQATRRRLVLGGGAVAVGAFLLSAGLVALLGEPAEPPGWDQLIAREPHSQMPLWLIGATGSAAFVLGGALVVAEAADRLVWPLVAAGQIALTVYVGHLLALHLAPDLLTSDHVAGAVALVGAFTVVAALFATAWRAGFARGPLEALLRPPWSWLPQEPSRSR